MSQYLTPILLLLHSLVALLTIGHVLLHKRDPRSALGWIATCILFQIAGPLLYFFFGINRIHIRAQQLWAEAGEHIPQAAHNRLTAPPTEEFFELATFAGTVTDMPLLLGNHIELLHDGEQAYPAMLAAINAAQRSVYLSSYIFKTDVTGQKFIDALLRAQQRGLDVKVLIDGYGDWYRLPRASAKLRKLGVNVRRFLPLRLLPPSAHINLRNHRKILVVDGQLAFTGGMNIGDHHLAANLHNKRRVTDLHFSLKGPITLQLEAIFLEDWAFATRSKVTQAFTEPENAGSAICRALTDGPNNDLDIITLTLVGAVAAARRSINIMTPYFLPPRELIAALQTAALRGVAVTIILPAYNNLPYVHWATRNMLWELLQYGVQIYYQPAPFAHAKLFTVDGQHAQIGSANLDPRSLRLNFEIMVEIYSAEVGQQLNSYFNRIQQQSRPVTRAELDQRPLHIRLLDAVFWLFSPYM
jgi:cardiolipin synthase